MCNKTLAVRMVCIVKRWVTRLNIFPRAILYVRWGPFQEVNVVCMESAFGRLVLIKD